jgi:hypothetical protein
LLKGLAPVASNSWRAWQSPRRTIGAEFAALSHASSQETRFSAENQVRGLHEREYEKLAKIDLIGKYAACRFAMKMFTKLGKLLDIRGS